MDTAATPWTDVEVAAALTYCPPQPCHLLCCPCLICALTMRSWAAFVAGLRHARPIFGEPALARAMLTARDFYGALL